MAAQPIKSIILLSIIVLVFQDVFSQQKPDSLRRYHVNTDFTLASKNVWRGINYGNNAPSLQGNLSLRSDVMEFGAMGTVTTNGTKSGYGNWLELYSSYTYKRWSLTIDDYYFFSYDSLNDYLTWNYNTTQHLVEARLKYAVDKRFSIFASYNIYANRYASKALYLEGEYFLRKDLSLLVSYLTGKSSLNFYDKGRITMIGIAGTRLIPITSTFALPIKVSLIVNPNYKGIAHYEGLGRNPVNFVIATSL